MRADDMLGLLKKVVKKIFMEVYRNDQQVVLSDFYFSECFC